MHRKQQLDNYLLLTKIPLGLYPEVASIMHVFNFLSGLGAWSCHLLVVSGRWPIKSHSSPHDSHYICMSPSPKINLPQHPMGPSLCIACWAMSFHMEVVMFLCVLTPFHSEKRGRRRDGLC
jgi:hypothetical protein